MARNEVVVRVDEEGIARAAATIREAGRQLAEALKHAQALSVEPWTIAVPHGGKLAGYVDEYNQEHWVHESQVAPDRYRKLYVEKRAPEVLFGADAHPQDQSVGSCTWPLMKCTGHLA